MYEYKKSAITAQALHRMPYYIQQLRLLKDQGTETVSAPKIAELLCLNEVQVRKDFAAVYTEKGKPRTGFPVTGLLHHMEELLGYHNVEEAVVVGTGALARAIIAREGFQNCGLDIVAVFNTDPQGTRTELDGVKVLPSDKISDLCRRMKIPMGIITVPASQAQVVCDQLVAGGVLAVWNFAPVHLSVPEHILVRNENLGASLAVLSNHLKGKMREVNIPV
ncbi:redox-sensing transcriptional repressor [Anaerotaenia torta]|uniref:redox-sensing transcriptional repressor Rex n=1 Tax=Anaerotaenia torta TaxID=433293 RepID=UPI003D1B31B1